MVAINDGRESTFTPQDDASCVFLRSIFALAGLGVPVLSILAGGAGVIIYNYLVIPF
jgi:hypothetical protein